MRIVRCRTVYCGNYRVKRDPAWEHEEEKRRKKKEMMEVRKRMSAGFKVDEAEDEGKEKEEKEEKAEKKEEPLAEEEPVEMTDFAGVRFNFSTGKLPKKAVQFGYTEHKKVRPSPHSTLQRPNSSWHCGKTRSCQKSSFSTTSASLSSATNHVPAPKCPPPSASRSFSSEPFARSEYSSGGHSRSVCFQQRRRKSLHVTVDPQQTAQSIHKQWTATKKQLRVSTVGGIVFHPPPPGAFHLPLGHSIQGFWGGDFRGRKCYVGRFAFQISREIYHTKPRVSAKFPTH